MDNFHAATAAVRRCARDPHPEPADEVEEDDDVTFDDDTTFDDGSTWSQ